MNAHILRNVMLLQRQNDQKVVIHSYAKTQHKSNKLIIVVKQCPPLSKPTLVKLTSKQFYKCSILMPKVWETCLEMQHHRWKRTKITKDDLIHPFYICMMIKNGMGCQKLGSRVH